jgi:hypothetical protein
MHKETEECHEIGQFSGFEFGDNPRNELRYKLCNGSPDSIDELGERESSLSISIHPSYTKPSDVQSP